MLSRGVGTVNPVPTNGEVMDQFGRLLTFGAAETWRAAEQILSDQPELSDPRFDTYLEQLIEGIGGNDPEAARLLRQRMALLSRCRTIGAEAAFAEQSRARSARRQPSNELLQMLETVGSMSDESEALEYIRTHPELLSAECDSLLKKVIDVARSRNDDFTADFLDGQRAFLARCRQQGVTDALEQRASGDDPFVLMQKAMQAQAAYEQSKPS